MKRKLKVAWISDFPVEWLPDVPELLRRLPRRHPTTWEVVLLSEFEKQPDIQVHVILLRRGLKRDFTFERNGTVFHVLKARPAFRLGSLFWLDTLLIRRVCRQIQPDLIHAWGNESGAALIAHRLGYPYLITVQGLFAWYKERLPLSGYLRLVELWERISLPRAPLVTVEASFAVRFLKQRHPRLCVRQAEEAPHPAFSQVVRRPQVSPVKFIYVGTLSFPKGTDLLLRALEQLSTEVQLKLTVISRPNTRYLESLRSVVSDNFLRQIEFKHDIPPQGVADELATATIFLMPTRADSGPTAVKEAVVAGVPVVGSQVGGIPDYVVPGKNGLMFPPGDLQQFVEAIRMACKHPLFSRGSVDNDTLNSMRTYLSGEQTAKAFISAYQIALGSSVSISAAENVSRADFTV